MQYPVLPLPLGEVPRRGGEGKKPSQSQLSLCQLSQRESQVMLLYLFVKLKFV